MKTCFVSMPLGVKSDPYTGVPIDFDIIYRDLIEPAILETEYKIYRIDDLNVFAQMQKLIIQSILTSDIMIADLTTSNPNVLYELGIRHMAQRGLTIMICASGTKIPFDISSFRVISYELNSDGTVSNTSRSSFHQLLRYSIESNLEQTVTDSPIYHFFPEISLVLPLELTLSESKSQVIGRNYKKKSSTISSSSNKTASIENLKIIQSNALGEAEEVDPDEFINLLKKYRDLSAWKDLVILAEKIPESLKKNPDVLQLYALALNRIGDQEKAIGIIKDLIDQTGGDAESYGILGRIYKDKYESCKSSNEIERAEFFLDEAIKNYKLGFEKQPEDFYTGVNVVNLLSQRHDSLSRDDLKRILPRVRESLKNKMTDSVIDYWVYATALELSIIAKEWNEADEQVRLALSLNPNNWMLETTIHNLKLLESEYEENEKVRMDKIIQKLMNVSAEGQRNA